MLRPLTGARRCAVLEQLAALWAAGLPPDACLAALRGRDPAVARRVDAAQRLLRRSIPIWRACHAAGLLTAADEFLLTLADRGGVVETMLGDLAERARADHAAWRQLRTHLVLPAAVITLAIFVRPLPAVAAGALDGGAYLAATFGELFRIAAGAALFVTVVRGRNAPLARSLGVGWLVDAFELLLPVLARRVRRRGRRDLLRQIGLLHRAGVPPLESAPLALAALANRRLARQWSSISAYLQAGSPLLDALPRESDWQPARMIVSAADAAGKLDESLLQFAARESESIAVDDEHAAAWLARAIYVLAIGWVASGTFGGELRLGAPSATITPGID